MTHNDFDLDDDIVEPINKFIRRNCVIDSQQNNLKEKESEIDKLYTMPEEIESYVNKNIK